ncbi:MAG TPA: tetratricopeptide repeat protein, partial [Chroococcales cyanobacterium]
KMNRAKLPKYLLTLAILPALYLPGRFSAANATQSTEAQTQPPSALKRGYEALNQYKCDEAILHFARRARAMGKQWQKEPAAKLALAHAYSLIGNGFLFDENDLAAANCFTIAHTLAPADPTITAYLALAKDRIGAPGVEKLLEQLEPFGGKDIVASEVLAVSYARRFDFDRSLKYLSNPAFQKSAHVQILIAKSLARKGLSDKALARYKSASEYASSPYMNKLCLAASLTLKDKVKEEELIREAGKNLPNDPAWRASLAGRLSSKNDEHAVAEYEIACAGPRVYTFAFTKFASYLDQHKRKKDAIRCMEYLQKLVPWSVRAKMNRAEIDQRNGDYDAAIKLLNESVATFPKAADAYWRLAQCYLSKNRPADALAAVQAGARQCPYYGLSWRWLGAIALKNGKWDDAAKAFQKAIDLLSPDKKDLNAIMQTELAGAHAGLGTCYLHDKENAKALEEATLFNQWKFYPKLPGLLGMVHLRPSKLDLSAGSPEQKKVNDEVLLADMLRETGQLDECIAHYRKAIEVTPDDIDLHSYLFDVLSEKGDLVQAGRENLTLSSKLLNRVPHEIEKLLPKKKKAENKDAEKSAEPTEQPAETQTEKQPAETQTKKQPTEIQTEK